MQHFFHTKWNDVKINFRFPITKIMRGFFIENLSLTGHITG